MFVREINKCLFCESEKLYNFLDLGEQTIQGSFVTKENQLVSRRETPLKVNFCHSCGLVQNSHVISPEILYQNYFYQSSISDTMRSHLKNVANSLTSYYKPNQYHYILDIGMNDGTLLKQYPDNFNKFGVDPSDIAAQHSAEFKKLHFINKCYPCAEIDGIKFSIIHSLACFYDIENTKAFCDSIYNNLGESGVWVCEFGYLLDMIKNMAYNQFLFEHVCSYSLMTFEKVIEKSGLKIIRAFRTPINAGSLQVWVVKKEFANFSINNSIFSGTELRDWQKEIQRIKYEEFDIGIDDYFTFRRFGLKVQNHYKNLKSFLSEKKSQGCSISILAASTKLNVILQAADIGPDLIPYAAERDPRKIGGETLSGIKMLSEDEVLKMKPNYLLCGINGFDNEIMERYKPYLESGGRIIFTCPDLRIVSKDKSESIQ